MNEETITETTQYLTFLLDREVFAVDISKVREVLDVAPITRVPGTPEYLRGIVNLRGSVVPVADIRLKFGMPKGEQTVHSRIIVLETAWDSDPVVLGALVDSVQSVLDLDRGQIEAPPRIGTRIRKEFIKGMGRHDEKFIVILDIDKVFSCEEPKPNKRLILALPAMHQR